MPTVQISFLFSIYHNIATAITGGGGAQSI